MGFFSLVTGMKGPSGFGSGSTAEQVTQGIYASNLTAIVTGISHVYKPIIPNIMDYSFLTLLLSWHYYKSTIGGASGIGEETVRVLALRGAHVIIAARNIEAAERTKESILVSNPSARIDTMKVDLSSIKSVRAFAEKFIATALPLNILINNAGIMFCPFKLSGDGIEMQFATNHIGHFLLTGYLLEKMKNTAKETGIEGRIVNLSSVMHRFPYIGGIRFDAINEKSRYLDKLAYGQSKLANVLHANELSRRLKEEGANITVNSVHPGIIMTKLMRYSSCLMKLAHFFSFPIWKNVPQGAATTCYVALHPQVKGVTGEYFCDCNITKASKLARDETLAKTLWDFSENMAKVV